jgi:hypothetical protein
MHKQHTVVDTLFFLPHHPSTSFLLLRVLLLLFPSWLFLFLHICLSQKTGNNLSPSFFFIIHIPHRMLFAWLNMRLVTLVRIFFFFLLIVINCVDFDDDDGTSQISMWMCCQAVDYSSRWSVSVCLSLLVFANARLAFSSFSFFFCKQFLFFMYGRGCLLQMEREAEERQYWRQWRELVREQNRSLMRRGV